MTAHRPARHFRNIYQASLSRRGFLAGAASLPLINLAGCATPGAASAPASLSFAPVAATKADTVTVPAGYTWKTLIAWGDPLYEGDGAFDRAALSEAESERRFGFNNDMLALFPADWSFPAPDAPSPRMILCANHEYAGPAMTLGPDKALPALTNAEFRTLYAQLGVGVVQVACDGEDFEVVREPAGPGAINRRITPFTEVVFSGPAAAHPWIVRAGAVVNAAEARAGRPAPKSGGVLCGTFANCAGGFTPWGTYLSAEENFNFQFGFRARSGGPAAYAPEDGAQAFDHASYFSNWYTDPKRVPQGFDGLPDQYDLALNPTGGALYGWTLEVDPYDPTFAPRKRTALGRRKGECATTALAKDGRCVVYAGDDQRNEFVFKFVTSKAFDPSDRLANRDLLDDGVLYAARFNEDNTGEWLALTLEAANAAAEEAGAQAFADLGDVMVRARHAARLLGATPMDRPEDVEAPLDANWVGLGTVLIACTENIRRPEPEPGNPRTPALDGDGPQPNVTGHIVRIDEDGADMAATTFTWDVFALAGDPASPDAITGTGDDAARATAWLDGQPTFIGDRFARPDNLTFDRSGHVFISTDGSPSVFPDCNDGVYAGLVNPVGPQEIRRFLVGPVGCEICGPLVAPGDRHLFAAIQHPGEDDETGKDFVEAVADGERTRPASSFPDGGEAWPRPAVIYVRRTDGGVLGG